LIINKYIITILYSKVKNVLYQFAKKARSKALIFIGIKKSEP